MANLILHSYLSDLIQESFHRIAVPKYHLLKSQRLPLDGLGMQLLSVAPQARTDDKLRCCIK